MISATLDTNIYIRIFQTGGPALRLLEYARRGAIRVDISEPVITETCGVLRVKFQWDGYRISDADRKLRAMCNLVSASDVLTVVKEDPDDDRILECAHKAKSDYIVTEDKDLLRLGQFGSVSIISLRDFLNVVLGAATGPQAN